MAENLKVGFIGLGFMGHGMAANILARGFPLTVLAHRKREAIEDLVARGAVEAGSPRDLAERSDVIVLCVTGPEQVDDLVRRDDGLAAGAAPGTIMLDCTTSAPATLLALADDFPGLAFVDAPLGRSPKEAAAGSLSVMVGASDAALDAVLPVLSAFATTIQHAGPLGSGHALKLINNIVSLGYAALYSEAIVLAEKAGLGIGAFDKLISSSRMNCEFFQTFMGWARNGDAESHKFALSTAEHTVSDALAFAEATGVEMPLAAVIRSTYAKAVVADLGDANLPELPRSVALSNGIDIAPVMP